MTGGAAAAEQREERYRLPVWATLAASVRVLATHWALWFKLLLPAMFLDLARFVYFGVYSPRGWATEGNEWYEILIGIAMLPAWTAWHRLVVLGRGSLDPTCRYRFGRWELDYVCYTLIFGVVAMPVIFIFQAASVEFIAASPASSREFVILGFAVGLVVAYAYALARLALVLPAAASGFRPGFRQVWRATRGNGLRLMFVVEGPLLLAGSIGAASIVLIVMATGNEDVMLWVAGLLLWALGYVFHAIQLSAESWAYLALAEGTAPSEVLTSPGDDRLPPAR